jgi:hypothetical protein
MSKFIQFVKNANSNMFYNIDSIYKIEKWHSDDTNYEDRLLAIGNTLFLRVISLRFKNCLKKILRATNKKKMWMKDRLPDYYVAMIAIAIWLDTKTIKKDYIITDA